MNQGRIIVITGSPGTGKTTTASAVAFQLNNHSTNRCYMGANKPCNSGFSLPFFPLADRRSHFL